MVPHPPLTRPATARNKAYWLGTATALSVAYIVASQALVDLPGWSILAFLFAVLLAGTMIYGHIARVLRIRLGTWLIVPAAFLAYACLRCFLGVAESKPWDIMIQLASAFGGGVAIALALQMGVRFRWLVYAQVASNLLQMLIVIFGLGPQPEGPQEDTFRFAGITGNANLLALQLTLGACTIWLLPRKAGLIPCVFSFIAVGFAVAVTGSRKALVIALFFLVLALIQAMDLVPREKRRLLLTWAIGVPCLLGLIFSPMLYQHATDVLAVRRAVEHEDSSYRVRADMIETGLQLWQKSPIFGNGTDSFRGLGGFDTYSHNNYVELLCDLGILGVLLFYALHFQAVLSAWHTPRTLKLYCCVFILMMLITDLAWVSYSTKQPIMILMILMAVTQSRYAIKEAPVALKRKGRSKSHSQTLQPRRLKPRRFLMRT
jgi:O-antigen ligase